ncbi:MAG TPA: HD domain-containing phosphohydrolase [Actinomycetota bacterium]
MRLADTLAALSLATDLAMGQPPEKAIRAAVLATEMARHLGLDEPAVADVLYTTLLKHLGCTATSHEEVTLFGPDDLGARPVAERTDDANLREMLGLFGTVGRGTGLGRVAYLARAAVGAKGATERIFRAVCEVGTRMAARLGLGAEVERGLSEALERWDGKGAPHGLRGEDIGMGVRIAEPATQAVIFHRLGGIDAALAMAHRRSGGWFDPASVEALRAIGPDVLARLEEEDPWEVLLEAEPSPVREIGPAGLDRVAEVFADMVDLKSPYLLGHSSGVAGLAAAAAERLGLPDPAALRRAGLLHDLGRIAVATGTWEKPGPLSTTEWEQVRLHPYHTERILERAESLRPIARIAGMHHERQDGSGYHRGSTAAEAPPEARVLAVADAYQAMTQDRPHRKARTPSEAAARIETTARDGRFDPECARGVLEAAGRPATRARGAWPSGLSDREVEVLRMVSRGLTNKQIAAALVISPRTAEHHVQHIYGKIGTSTRAAAAMFAMEHGLLR